MVQSTHVWGGQVPGQAGLDWAGLGGGKLPSCFRKPLERTSATARLSAGFSATCNGNIPRGRNQAELAESEKQLSEKGIGKKSTALWISIILFGFNHALWISIIGIRHNIR
eukprot:EG_transcript_62375